MKTLNIIPTPYNDDVLEWNNTLGRYQLTLEYVKTLRDALPYRNDRVTKKRINDTSTRVYNYIVTHSNTANRQVIYFLLNKTENGRQFLVEVLTAQMEGEIDYAYADIIRRPTINLANGQIIDREAIRTNAISIETENAIDDSANYFGFNICVMFPFAWSLFDLARKYED